MKSPLIEIDNKVSYTRTRSVQENTVPTDLVKIAQAAIKMKLLAEIDALERKLTSQNQQMNRNHLTK